jgi:hypothetical protein
MSGRHEDHQPFDFAALYGFQPVNDELGVSGQFKRGELRDGVTGKVVISK